MKRANLMNNSSQRRHRPFPRQAGAYLAAAAGVLLAGTVWALPQGAQVVHGQASIAEQGHHATITAGNDAIINYQQFNIAGNESVRFVQPGSTSRVLNRVVGGDASHIAGEMRSNGIVYLVNQAGIYFSKSAQLNVAGLYAAAGQLTNDNFLHHIDLFTGMSGKVVSAGSITGHNITLLGKYVANRGNISAPNGTITMLAGKNVYLTQVGGHVMVKLDGKALNAATPAAGSATPTMAGRAGVENSGSVAARGGQITLGAGDMYSLAMRNTGRISAGSGSVAVAATDGVIDNAGTISASVDHGQAGSVAIAAPHLVNQGTVAADSHTGHGGSVSLVSDKHTFLMPGSTVSAAGGTHGGHVLVNSIHGLTAFRHGASINVAGGHAGGEAEVSGHELDFHGSVDLGSVNPGTLLLDPVDLEIVSGEGNTNPTAGTVNFSATAGNGPNGDGTNATVSAEAIEGLTGAVVLSASRDLFDNAPLTLSPTIQLQMTATRNLEINAPITINGTSNVGVLMTLQALNGTLHISAPMTLSPNVSLRLFSGSDMSIAGNISNINTIQATVHGTLFFHGGSVQSAGGQAWSDSTGQIALQSDTTLTAPTVAFVGAAIDGNHNLTINGTAVFGGTVGQNTALNGLSVSGKTILAGGSVTTFDRQTYQGPVTLVKDAELTSTNGSIFFDSSVDGAHALTVNALGNITFRGAVGQSGPLTGLNANYGHILAFPGRLASVHTTGDINFNAAGRDNIPARATITAINGDLSFISDTGSFNMGQNEKLTDVGNLTISAANGSATLGDVNTLGNMTVTANSIQVRTRPGGNVELANGDGVADTGVDLVAGGQFAFSVAPVSIGGNAAAIFSSAAAAPDATGVFAGNVKTNVPVTQQDLVTDGTVLDLKAQAPAVTPPPVNPPVNPPANNPAAILATALPLPAAGDPLLNNVPTPVLLGPGGQQSLAALNVNVRPFTVADLQASLSGHQTINDVSFASTGGQTVTTVARINRQAAEDALAQYQALFVHQVTNGKGKVSTQNQTEAIREALAGAWTAYIAQGGMPGNAKAFAAFVTHAKMHKQAAAYMTQLRTLLATLGQTGLTTTELASVESRLLAPITPAGVHESVLDSAITGQPSILTTPNQQARVD